jgi:predicted DCC family thiol-disulfide oxidoreductase YuxK
MERYLVFDAGCGVCSSLAARVTAAADGKLVAVDIRGEQAKGLLDRAFPAGWRHAPYFVEVRDDRVQAHTGWASALRLAQLMGPRRAWRVWSLARQAGVTIPPGGAAWMSRAPTRRHALRLAGALVGAAAWLGLQRDPASVQAYCGYCSTIAYGWCNGRCAETYCDQFIVWNRYRQAGCVDYCYQEATWAGCQCYC